MAGIAAVHECLFCTQTFGSAVDKDDHVLGHFSHEICTDCDQTLIQIGGKLYTLHDTVTCVKRELKAEPISEVQNVCHDIETIEHEPNNQSFKLGNELHSIDIQMQPSWQMRNVTVDTDLSDDYKTELHPNNLVDRMKIEECIAQNEDEDTVMTEIVPIEVENTESSRYQVTCSEASTKTGGIECEVCGNILSSKAALRRHIVLLHSAPGTIFCRTCGKLFSTQEKLDEHRPDCLMKRRASNKKLRRVHRSNCVRMPWEEISTQAELDKYQQENLMKKINKYTGPFDKFECGICKELLSTKWSLRVHLQRKHNCDYMNTPWKRVTFQRTENNQDIRFEHNTELPNNCQTELVEKPEEKPNEYIPQNEQKDTIIIETEPIGNGKTEPNRSQLKTYSKPNPKSRGIECEICGRWFKTKGCVRRHTIREHSSSGTFLCSNCCISFFIQAEFDEHRSKCLVKKKIKNENIRDTKFECGTCKSLLSNKWNLRVHMQTMHNSDYMDTPWKEVSIQPNEEEIKREIDSYECYLCKCKLLYKQSLDRHIFTKHVSMEKPFQCDLCSTRFWFEHQLKVHVCPAKNLSEEISKKTNKQVKAIPCQICNEIFDTKQSFTSHVLKHNSKRRRFKCEKCWASFWKEEDLQEHICARKTSSVCHICGTTTRRYSLLRHMKKVHGSSTLQV